MADANLQIVLRAKDEAQADIRALQTSLKRLGGAMGETGQHAHGMGERMKQATGHAHGLDLSLKGLAKQVGMVASGFIVAKVSMAAVTGVFGGLAGSIIGLNSRLEQATVAFTTMLGSAQEAEQFLRQLQEFAARTPFEFKELTAASQRMLAMGFAAKEVIPLLTSIGNAAAALGGSKDVIDRITLALGQMSARTKVSAQDMRQLTEVGVPAWQILADTMGMTVGEVMELSEQGKIAADVMIDGFQEFVGRNYGDMMAKQALTAAGAWTTVKDTVNIFLAEAGEPLFKWVRDLTVEISQYLQSADFQAWADRSKKSIEQVAEAMERLGKSISTMFGGEGKAGAFALLQNEIDKIAQLGLAFVAAQRAFEMLRDSVSDGSDKQKSKLQQLISPVELLKGGIRGLFQTYGLGSDKAIESLQRFIESHKTAEERIADAYETIANVGQTKLAALKNMQERATEAAREMAAALTEPASSSPRRWYDIAAAVANSIVTGLGPAFQALGLLEGRFTQVAAAAARQREVLKANYLGGLQIWTVGAELYKPPPELKGGGGGKGGKAPDSPLEQANKILALYKQSFEVIAKIGDLVPPAQEKITAAAAQIGLLGDTLAKAFSTQWNEQAMAAAGGVADTMGKFISTAGAGLDLLSKLTDYEQIAESRITTFAQDLYRLTDALVQSLTGQWTPAQLMASAIIGETVGTFLSTASAGLDLLVKLADYEGVAEERITRFSADLTTLAVRLVTDLTSKWTPEQLKGADIVADTVGKFMATAGAGLGVLVALKDLSGDAADKIDGFTSSLMRLADKLRIELGQWKARMFENAALVAEPVGKLISGVAGAVGGLTSIAKDFQAPSDEAIDAFAHSLGRVASRLVDAIGHFDVATMEAMAKLGDSTGNLVQGAGQAISALTNLVDYKGLADPEKTAALFAADLAAVATAVSKAISEWDQEATAAVAKLAESTGKVVQGAGAALSALTGLLKYEGLPDASAVGELFAHDLVAVAVAIGAAVDGFEQETLDKAAKLSESAGKIVGSVGQAIDPLIRLADYVGLGEKGPAIAEALAQDLTIVLDSVIDALNQVGEERLTQGGGVSEAAQKLVQMVGAAIDPLVKLRQFLAPSEYQIQAFINAFGKLFDKLEQFVKDHPVTDEMMLWSKDLAEFAKNFAESLNSLGLTSKGVGMAGGGSMSSSAIAVSPSTSTTSTAPAQTTVNITFNGDLVASDPASLVDDIASMIDAVIGRRAATLAAFGVR